VDGLLSSNNVVYCIIRGARRRLKKGDTGMYDFDLVSIVTGYILGVLLYHSVARILVLEKDYENE
jgi:hypothetical protein